MHNYGLTSVAEFLEDFVVYRNLVPMDGRLSSLAQMREDLGIPDAVIPRKSAPDYARVIVSMLEQARALEASRTSIARLIYVGDTCLNDGTAFCNICHAGNWPGLAFIGSEKDAPPRVEMREQKAGTLYLANRWALLRDFDEFCGERDFPVDERTAVIVDLDKTALGARGRNDHVIDQARVAAVRRTVESLLGTAFDPERFQTAYDVLNQTEFHPFTTDNQDYLAYMCLIVGSGLWQLDTLVKAIRDGRVMNFVQFIIEVEARAADLPSDGTMSLRDIHRDIYAYVRAGDPTPFKAFRYNEYRETVARMGTTTLPVPELLHHEIVITQEVREMALQWKAQGALLFGLSDKPDEASLPTEDLMEEGDPPIHRALTHAVGE
ncbi:MAG: hypothetical protein JXA33_25240 [Anaerolineae bacterium]|nr:hypothetical protein [Anaerolineae bacterium]